MINIFSTWSLAASPTTDISDTEGYMLLMYQIIFAVRSNEKN